MKKSSLLLGLISAVTSIFAGNNAKTGDIQYIANNGQWANHILYSTPVYGGNLFLEQNCFTYYFSNMSEIGELHHSGNKNQLENFIIKKHAFRVSFVGANPNITLGGENKFANYYNYFLGNDQSRVVLLNMIISLNRELMLTKLKCCMMVWTIFNLLKATWN